MGEQATIVLARRAPMVKLWPLNARSGDHTLAASLNLGIELSVALVWPVSLHGPWPLS